MFFKSNRPAEDGVETHLTELVHGLMPTADRDTARIVAACAGLLACVAYADGNYSDAETQRVHELLKSIEGIGDAGATAVVTALRADIVEIATVHSTRFTRTLMDLADRDLRYKILELLLEVAAADDQITHDEVKTLRQLTAALGLEQADYNELQAKHRDKLTILRP